MLVAALLTLAWGSESAYNAWRLRSGPSAWFIVMMPQLRATYLNDPYPQKVISGPFSNRHLCEDELKRPPILSAVACRRLLLTDAKKMSAF